ncbi:unnamed protein product [Meloidogyne enterolobii]|uniref:Uncharacterized protein n=1 Tax=Meloidogyne enterolobii TaxID=390850 RepID=A0ACB0ZHR9_MELEN
MLESCFLWQQIQRKQTVEPRKQTVVVSIFARSVADLPSHWT